MTTCYAYIANYGGGSGNVTLVDTAATPPAVLGNVTAGSGPFSVAFTPDGSTVYVTNKNGNNVSYFPTGSTSVTVSTYNHASFNVPIGIAVSGRYAYVVNSGGNSVTVLDISGSSPSYVKTISTDIGSSPELVVFSLDGRKAYVANTGDTFISVIDTIAQVVIKKINVAHATCLALSRDGSLLYAPTAVSPYDIQIIDAQGDVILGSISSSTFNLPRNAAITPDGKLLYLTNSGSPGTGTNTVSMIDLTTSPATITAIGSSTYFDSPCGISITPDGSTVYVTNAAGNDVSHFPTHSTSPTITNLGSGSNFSGPNAYGPFIQPQSIPMTSLYTAPQGRLTLTSGVPVMTADVTPTGSTPMNVYYTPYVGDIVPVYDGTSTWTSYPLNGQLTMALDATKNTSTNMYDLFAFLNSGSVIIGAGPAWTNGTSLSTRLQQINGLWVNASSITPTNGSTTYGSVGAKQATYLGSVYMTANAQTKMQFNPAPATGGTDNVLGLYNAYNRVFTQSMERDSTVNWTSTSTTWGPLNPAGSNLKNRISWVDGLQQSFVNVSLNMFQQISSPVDGAGVGVSLNSITVAPDLVIFTNLSPSTSCSGAVMFLPKLGFNYMQAMQTCFVGGTATFVGNPYQTMVASLEM